MDFEILIQSFMFNYNYVFLKMNFRLRQSLDDISNLLEHRLLSQVNPGAHS